MTDILPPAGWPNVRQLETNEFATGGANGNMNEQAKSLAARSELLKQYAALPYESKTGGYALNERVQLANGDIVRSTIPSNVNNPNEDMTGWGFDDNTVESIANLLAIKNPKNGQDVSTASYWKGLGKGGNGFVYDSNMPRSRHNGGTIIDPTKAWDGSREQWAFVDGYLPDVGVGAYGVDDESKLTTEVKQAILDRGGSLALGAGLNPTNFRTNQIKLGGFLGASSNTGFGCWVAKTKEISFTMFGAVGDAQENIDGTDDSFAMLACVQALPKTGAVLDLENYYYTHGNGDIRNIVLHFMNFNNLIIKGNLASIQSHSNNLSVTSQAIMRFDYCKDVSVFCLNTDARLDTRMVVGGDPNTNNDQHNIHIGLGCKDFTFFKCSANRAIMDGFYIYGWGDSGEDSTQNITFYDCKAHYCYRQGSSHIEGLNIRYIGGSYSYTGTLPNPTGGTKGTAPMSGIDIESNGDSYASRATFECDGVSFIGNKQKGLIFSKNSYGVARNCTFKDNLYMGAYIEHNSIDATIDNCHFNNNVNSIYNEFGASALITNNYIYDVTQGINVNYRADIGHKDYSKTVISKNKFITPNGLPQGKSISADWGGVEIEDNTFINVSPLWLGGDGNAFASVERNKFTNESAEVDVFINTWSGSRIKTLLDNDVVLTAEDASLLSTDVKTGTISRDRNTVNSASDSVKIVDGSQKLTFSIQVVSAPNVPANSSVTIEYTTTGVAPNNHVSASYNASMGGVYLSAVAAGWGKTRVIFVNPTASPIQVLSGYLSIITL